MYMNLKPKKSLSITEIVIVKKSDLDKNNDMPCELSSFWTMIYVKNGQAKISFNSGLINVGREHLIILPPNSLYDMPSVSGSQAGIFCIAFSCGCKRLNDITGPHQCNDEQILILSHILNNTELIFNKVRSGAGHDESFSIISTFGSEQIVKEYLELLLIDIINNPRIQKSSRKSVASRTIFSEEILFKDICDYLNDNLSSNLSVNDICRKFFISSSSIKKLFSSRCGCGVIKFFHRLKIEKAKEYIASGTMNFTEISEALGFSSLHYFSRYFKIITGLSPTDYMFSQAKL